MTGPKRYSRRDLLAVLALAVFLYVLALVSVVMVAVRLYEFHQVAVRRELPAFSSLWETTAGISLLTWTVVGIAAVTGAITVFRKQLAIRRNRRVEPAPAEANGPVMGGSESESESGSESESESESGEEPESPSEPGTSAPS
jgi:hypothetical protein